ncbi:hypothetical protein [Microbacterium azadirachtae]|uniref:hypothetical protein n=1 Tax=Microbacterium azadirachtae TaxID=582680 RepID=UPI000888E78B|nr:hypothetical protein [Microbacterium azadirachtae]SDM20567.1 thiosulfate dehydrogenase [quinone] large subunit [Microbacterium azadirachtae]SEG42750.1 thiosulfate dehydrogenase [quinone] large subunit [Microbacterium azadirachtae]SEG45883.1 thiosulfate dehydrogenase [quinone] large subunit [Microbacterium azadirachtae]
MTAAGAGVVGEALPAEPAVRRGTGLLRAGEVVGTLARIAAGALWLGEGLLKYRAGFGSADILLVAQGSTGNSRVPFYFRPLGALMQATPGLFGFAIPALEVALGILLVLGLGRVLTTITALGSVATLMLYWSSDQLITQYPLMTLLSAIVLALPWSGRFGVAWLWARRRGRGVRRGG